MYNTLLGRYFLVASFLFSFITTSGCSSGSSDNSENNEPTEIEDIIVTSPSSISWEEGSASTHRIETNQNSGLRFSLLDSDDASFFAVNSDTGVISAKEPLDFENPLDKDRDGIYELTLTIASSSNNPVNHDLSIEVINENEFDINIHFPAPNGNLGGSADRILIRGSLISKNQNNNQNVNQLKLLINGTEAHLENNLNWSAEIPLEYGTNLIDLSLGLEFVDTTKSINIDNSYILDKTSAVTNGKDGVIYISRGGNQLLHRELDSEIVTNLVGLDNFLTEGPCDSFTKIRLLNDSNILQVSCKTSNEDSLQSDYFYDLQDNVVSFLGNDRIPDDRKIFFYQNQFIVQNEGPYNILVNDIQTDQQIVFEKSPLLDCFPQSSEMDFAFDNNSLYEICEELESGTYNVVRYSLPNFQNLGNQPIAVNAEFLFSLDNTNVLEFINPSRLRLHFINNQLLIMSFPELFFFSVDGGLNDWHTAGYLDDSVRFTEQLIYFSELDRFVLGNDYSHVRFEFNLDDYFVNKIVDGTTYLDFGYYFYNEAQNRIKGFSNHTNRSLELNLDDFRASEISSFDSSTTGLSQNINFSHYEPSLDQFYISNFSYWGFNPPNDSPIFSIFDVKSNEISTYFSVEDFRQYLSVDNQINFIIEKIVSSHIDNTVLFSATFEKSNEWVSRGLYTYNLESAQFSTIDVETNNTDIYSSGLRLPYTLSHYYEDIDGYFLTSWDTGSIDFLSSDWSKRSIVSNWSSYGTTWAGHYNPSSNEFYFGGYSLVPETSEKNYDHQLIDKLTLTSLELERVASTIDNQVLSLDFFYFALDPTRQLIYQIQGNSLLQIDLVNGYRTLIPIQFEPGLLNTEE